MSKPAPSNPNAGLMPLDTLPGTQPGNPEDGGGVFRLDSMGGPAEGAPEALVAPKKGRLSMQTLFLGLLLLGGGGLIYGMRIVGIGPLSAIANAKVPEYDLSKPGSRTAEHQRVLNDLNTSHVKAQVPVDQVQKNPFRMADVLGPETTTEDPAAAAKASAERFKRDQEAKRRRVESTLASLKVHGILGGSNPVARIGDQAVRVGEMVADMFTVSAIHGRSVDLEFEGDIFTLNLDDDSANSNSSRSAPRTGGKPAPAKPGAKTK